MTATCLNNLGLEGRFAIGTSYPVELVADSEMLLVTDLNGEKVEVFRERFKFDSPLPIKFDSPLPKPLESSALSEIVSNRKEIDELLGAIAALDTRSGSNKEVINKLYKALDPLIPEEDL